MSKHTIDPNKWVQLYSNYLFNYTISRVNDREIAKDLIQETFIAGLKSMKNFNSDARERIWLISILKRNIIDRYRKISYNDDESEGDWLEERVANAFKYILEEGVSDKTVAEKFKTHVLSQGGKEDPMVIISSSEEKNLNLRLY